MELHHLADADGVLLRRGVLAAGFDDKVLTRALRRGSIVRIRHGAYALAPVWEAADGDQRHRLLTAAVRNLYDDRVAASHVSACLEYGAPSWGHDLSRVHLTHLFAHGDRTAAGIVHHRGACGVGDLTRDERGWITSPGRTATDAAILLEQEAAVVMLDWFLQQGLVSRDEMEARRESLARWPGSLPLIRALQLADGKAESPGETRFRLLCRAQGVPAPVAQFEVSHPSGRLAGRVDFAWPEFGVIVEFDGREKYHRFRRPGETIEQCVMREKAREDLLRELTGWIVVRITWADLARPAETAARLRRAMTRRR